MRGQNFAPAAKTARPQKALPVPILEAIAWHHCPGKFRRPDTCGFDVLVVDDTKMERFRLKQEAREYGRDEYGASHQWWKLIRATVARGVGWGTLLEVRTATRIKAVDGSCHHFSYRQTTGNMNPR